MVTIVTRLRDRPRYRSDLHSWTHKTHNTEDAASNLCWKRTPKTDVFRSFTHRSGPRAPARSNFSVFPPGASNQVSITHLEMKVIYDALTVNNLCRTWCSIERFFHSKCDPLYRARRAKFDHIRHSLLG